ncbi:MAG: ribose-5-phosphate isomerase RpiA [Thermoplasmatota archaeon]
MDQESLKRQCGEAAAAQVQDGMVVGLGTGSTVKYTILELARRVREEGLQIVGIPTSDASEILARDGGIPLTTLDDHPVVDLTIDGADEFDPSLNLIKGGGGALTREKIVAKASKRMVVVADESKRVQHLGSTFALPVEVVRLALEPTRRLLVSLGADVTARPAHDGSGLYLTDNGHPILDAKWGQIDDPAGLERTLCLFPGIVECGLFLGLCDEVVMAGAAGIEHIR